MREILFRGKTSGNEWVYGNLSVIGDVCFISADMGFNKTVIPKTIGQYTGLTDNYGKKIFEGDIIKQEFSLNRAEREVLSSIEYGTGYAYCNVYGVCQRFKDGSGVSLLSVFNESGMVLCEVIGNIHDNPELLKGE